MRLDNNQYAFFELLRAGLFPEREFKGSTVQQFKEIDWDKVYLLALEQSVQGLVLQGLEWFMEQGAISKDDTPQELLLQWIGEVQMIEQQNLAMNEFVAWLIERLRKEDIYALLVKGQGIAQCYENPLLRTSGDVDLLLSEDDYEKTKKALLPLAADVETEYTHLQHIGMTINGWVVELHGTLHGGLSTSVVRELDDIKKVVFYDGKVRSWMNNQTQIFLPAADEDVVYVFSHILHHFFFEGIGLRQICDWCRLLWIYKDSLNHELLETRIRKMGLMTEWKAFAVLAVEYLGMPVEAMPLLDSSNVELHSTPFTTRPNESKLSMALATLGVQEFKKFMKKADKICKFVLEVGNFGHNRDYAYQKKYPYMVFKAISLWKHFQDFGRYFVIFPLDAINVTCRRICVGIVVTLKGK